MNYFELYGLPISFRIDKTILKKKFFELSRQYHPDFHAGATAEKQAEVLNLSTLNTKAWEVLSDPDQRTEYILLLTGSMEKEEKYTLSPVFLGEMMEINEALMGLELDPDPNTLSSVNQEVTILENNLLNEFTSTTQQYDAGQTDSSTLKKIKELHYRRKYLLRIRSTLNTFAAR